MKLGPIIVHEVDQGSQEWVDLRKKHYCASDAAAMMGESPYKTRDELLREYAEGVTKEVSEYTQALFDKGHEAEAQFRPQLEERIGEELFPATVTREVDGLSLLASSDGLNDGLTLGLEHKLYNESLINAISLNEDIGFHKWQLEGSTLVTGVEKIIFACSDGTLENSAIGEYYSAPELRKRLIAGWKQFDEDLKNYAPKEPEAIIEPKTIENLPAIRVQVRGEVVSSNLPEFEHAAKLYIKGINTTLETDEDFAHAEQDVKHCEQACKKIDSLKDQILSQTADIESVFSTLESVRKALNNKRLTLDKLVKSEKQRRKTEITSNGKIELDEYIKSTNLNLKGNYIPSCNESIFRGAIKGMSKLANIVSKVNDVVAMSKMSVTEEAEKVRVNLQLINSANRHLFPDLELVARKEAEDFRRLVDERVTASLAEKQKQEDSPIGGRVVTGEAVLRPSGGFKKERDLFDELEEWKEKENVNEKAFSRLKRILVKHLDLEIREAI